MSEECCTFCAIVAGRLPAHVIFETADLICFFPREPDVCGHTLIVSKVHHADIRDSPPSLGARLFEVSQILAQTYRDRIGATGFNLLNANGIDAEQSVPHLHFHFLPRFASDGFSAWPTFPPFESSLDEIFNLLKI